MRIRQFGFLMFRSSGLTLLSTGYLGAEPVKSVPSKDRKNRNRGSFNGTHFGGIQTEQIYGNLGGISLIKVHCLGWYYNDS